MTDLPFGRGGTPLQNLIVSGYKETKLSAILVNAVYDGGKIWSKKPTISLHGSAKEIYKRAREFIDVMIQDILYGDGEFAEQGECTRAFKRRTPEESDMSTTKGLKCCYDFIRMLDADGYPHAFLKRDGMRYEFVDAVLEHDCVTANVRITYDKG